MQYYVLTYTGGVGWQEKETKAESQVHSALKMTYYEAFSEARKALNVMVRLVLFRSDYSEGR